MGTQNTHAEDFFTKMGRKLDEMAAELNSARFSKHLELESRLAELKRNKESIEHEFENFTTDNKVLFNDLARSFEESVEDIKERFRKDKKKRKR